MDVCACATATAATAPAALPPPTALRHRECYSSWWLWRQAALREQEAALVAHTGASAASVLRVRACVCVYVRVYRWGGGLHS